MNSGDPLTFFKEFLLDHNALDAYINNLKNESDLNDNMLDYYTYISNAFGWYDSNERYDYWQSIAHHWVAVSQRLDQGASKILANDLLIYLQTSIPSNSPQSYEYW